MTKSNIDVEFSGIVYHILINDEFNKIKNIRHHGINRFDHSFKVAYYSYKIAKKMRLDYVSVARGGLLHDFFLSDDERTNKDRVISTFTHPKKALEYAELNFELNQKEIDMIRTHMFPINLAIPKYIESWLVSIVDKIVSVSEFSSVLHCRLSYVKNIAFILFFTRLR